MKKPMTNKEVIHFLNETMKLSTDPTASAYKLRKAAQCHASLIQHHSLCIENLLDNADEAEMNKRMGEERRAENPPPVGPEKVEQ